MTDRDYFQSIARLRRDTLLYRELIALGIPQEQLWKELGYTDDQIKDFQDAKQQAADAQMAAINVQRAQLGLQADQQAAKNPDTAVEQRLRQQQNGQ
jgi:hypothetical protein